MKIRYGESANDITVLCGLCVFIPGRIVGAD
jgi:hypothetical protein